LPLAVAHGAKFELRCLSRWFAKYLADHPVLGPLVRAAVPRPGYFPVRSCTLLESFTSGDNPRHGLKDITEFNFHYKMRELLDLFPDNLTAKEAKSIRFNVLDQHNAEVTAYACEDALWCLAHHLYRFPRVRDLFIYKTEMADLYVICDM
jgi:hypothetical protein